jgi:hypothetical protein
MDNNYLKYLKYKNKYLELKNQVGGILTEEELSNIEEQIILNKSYQNRTEDINNINEFYTLKVKTDNEKQFKSYIDENRKIGKKIMLIVGAVPEQHEKFIIPKNYVPVYIENDFIFQYYNGTLVPSSIRINLVSNIKANTFDKYPLIIHDIFSKEFKDIGVRFDLIIFDTAVCKFISFNYNYLMTLFNLTFDNSSLIVMDNNTELYLNPVYSKIKSIEFKNKTNETELMDKYNNYIHPLLIINKLNSWFKKYFGEKININVSTYLDNKDIKDDEIENDVPYNKFINLCKFYINLIKMSSNNLKTTLLYYDKNIFINDLTLNVYLYFTNTKKILNSLVNNSSRINELKEYVNTNREKGNKIMLIVGASPDQQDHFVIPEKYVPVYVEKDETFNFYGGFDPKNNMLTKSFNNYPLLICDVLELYKYEDVKYDLIIFDKEVCKFNNFTFESLINLFKLTFDNSSVIVIDPDIRRPIKQTNEYLLNLVSNLENIKKFFFKRKLELELELNKKYKYIKKYLYPNYPVLKNLDIDQLKALALELESKLKSNSNSNSNSNANSELDILLKKIQAQQVARIGSLETFNRDLYKDQSNLNLITSYLYEWFKITFGNNINCSSSIQSFKKDNLKKNLDNEIDDWKKDLDNEIQKLKIQNNIDLDEEIDNLKKDFENLRVDNTINIIFNKYNVYYSPEYNIYGTNNPELYIYFINTKTI